MSNKRYKTLYEKNMYKLIQLCNTVVLIYTILMFAVFPYYLRNAYSTSREDKYHFFVILTLIALSAIAVLFAINYQHVPKNGVKVTIVEYIGRSKLNLADFSILAFWVINFLSAAFASLAGGDFMSFVSGTNGRNMGLLTISMLVISYFLISRMFCYKKYFFYITLIGMSFMSVLAVLNYYYIDPLNIFDNYSSQSNVIRNFTSTIGNKNYLSAMICVALPLAMGVAIATRDKMTYIIANICVGIQFMSLIVATSDGGFLGCFVGISVLLLYSARDIKRFSRFFICATVIVASGKLLWLFDIFMKGNNKGYTSFSRLFIYDHRIFFFIPVFIFLAILFSKIKDEDGKISKCTVVVVRIILLVFVIVCALLFIYYTSNPEIETNEITSFFRFDEEWGTHRGFFWIKSFEMFKNFSFRETLFGVGPANFVEPFLIFDSELIARYNETHADAAHNVYINYLITCGILGFVTYLVFILSVLRDALRSAKNNPMAFMLLGALTAYLAQDFVNLANPVNTPWLFIIIALSQASFLKCNSPEHTKQTF